MNPKRVGVEIGRIAHFLLENTVNKFEVTWIWRIQYKGLSLR